MTSASTPAYKDGCFNMQFYFLFKLCGLSQMLGRLPSRGWADRSHRTSPCLKPGQLTGSSAPQLSFGYVHRASQAGIQK